MLVDPEKSLRLGTGGSGWTGILASEGAFVKQVLGRISGEQESAGRCCGV